MFGGFFSYSVYCLTSVNATGSMKRQNSISFDSQQQPSSNWPGTPMDFTDAGQPLPTPKPPPSVSRSKVNCSRPHPKERYLLSFCRDSTYYGYQGRSVRYTSNDSMTIFAVNLGAHCFPISVTEITVL